MLDDADASSRTAGRTAFARQGFLAIERITDEPDVARIRRIAEDLLARKAGFEEGRMFDMLGPEDGTPPSSPQILRPHLDAPELHRTRFFAAAESLARDLLGGEARFVFDHIICKPAFAGAGTPWHQDEAFRRTAARRQEVSIWLPLQPVDHRNGCMRFIPGSHLGEVLEHRSPADDPRVHALECAGGFDPATAVECPLPLGGCTVHAERTLHGAGPNGSDSPRYAYVVVFGGPSRRGAAQRGFAWLREKRTARQARALAWLARGGIFQVAWRGLTARARDRLRDR